MTNTNTPDTAKANRIKIDGELLEVEKVHEYGYLPMIVTSDGCEYYIAESSEHAGEKTAEYWRDMAENDPKEFACIIGEERLIQWAMGQSDGFGISSFDEFLERVAEVPEENWASYDGQESEVERCGRLAQDVGFTPTVAYRHN